MWIRVVSPQAGGLYPSELGSMIRCMPARTPQPVPRRLTFEVCLAHLCVIYFQPQFSVPSYFGVEFNKPLDTTLFTQLVVIGALGTAVGGMAVVAFQYLPRAYRSLAKVPAADTVELLKGVRLVAEELDNLGFKPDVVVALSRSGCIFAGMLSVYLDVDEIVSFGRKRVQRPDHGSLDLQTAYEVGSMIRADPDSFRGKNILFVTYVVDTGETLDSTRDFLHSQCIDVDQVHTKVATVYINPGAKLHRSHVISAFETQDVNDVLDRVPWRKGSSYKRI